MAANRTKHGLKPRLRGFGVPALAGGAVARSSAWKFFEVILFVSAPPLEGGTPNLHPLLNLGLQCPNWDITIALMRLLTQSAVLESASLARKRNLPERQTLNPTVAVRFSSSLRVRCAFALIRMLLKPGYCEQVHFINTLLQRGGGEWWRGLNRFSGFPQIVETVETVLRLHSRRTPR